MEVILLGDIHGDVEIIKRVLDLSGKLEIPYIIQLGDFGLMNNDLSKERFYNTFAQHNTKGSVFYFIDGNHDECTWLDSQAQGYPVEIFPGLTFIPRGSVLPFGKMRIGFLGGAASIDKKLRLKQDLFWDSNEEVTQEQVERLHQNAIARGGVDVLITHCPPHSTGKKFYNPDAPEDFGMPRGWVDPSAYLVDTAWRELGSPPVFSGHLHVSGVVGNARILNINEIGVLSDDGSYEVLNSGIPIIGM